MIHKKNNNIYIADIQSILPNKYATSEVVDILYPKEKDSDDLNRYVHRIAANVGVKNRYSVLDPGALPYKKLAKESFNPLSWGMQMIDHFSKKIDLKHIGFLSISYNISSHGTVLPNLACQLAAESGLKLDSIPEEISYYGCASGIYSLNSAVEYCRNSRNAAVVFIFDQCSWGLQPEYDKKDPTFKNDLRSNLLFSDGAIGLLVIPEELRKDFAVPLLKIEELILAHQPGNLIRMHNGGLILEKEARNIVPKLATDNVVRPLLEKLNYKVQDIQQWSIHQGGLPILQKFGDEEVLGLTEKQLEASKMMFAEHGNMSSPSAFIVLEHFFKVSNAPKGTPGITVSFGAGYYLAAFIYTWQ